VKQQVIQQCRFLGWHPKDDNAADALALWDYACSRTSGEHAIGTAGMFANAGTTK
jgi:hypothetical protein